MLLHAFGLTSNGEEVENEPPNENDDDSNTLDIDGYNEDSMGDSPEDVGKIPSEKIEPNQGITPSLKKKVSNLVQEAIET